jgi:hypothetical protein
MATTHTGRAEVRELADRLVTEYAGTVPTGQVLALVHRTAGRLAAVPGLSLEVRLEICEVAARRTLADRIATSRRTRAA